jgi:hypothetical protein
MNKRLPGFDAPLHELMGIFKFSYLEIVNVGAQTFPGRAGAAPEPRRTLV